MKRAWWIYEIRCDGEIAGVIAWCQRAAMSAYRRYRREDCGDKLPLCPIEECRRLSDAEMRVFLLDEDGIVTRQTWLDVCAERSNSESEVMYSSEW
jgi:hypothetical protein